MYVHRFQNVFLRCPTPRLHCFLSSHRPSFRFLSFIAFLFLPSSFTCVFLVLSFVSASTSMLFWVIFFLPFFEHGRFVTFNKYAINFNFDNEMKTTVTLVTHDVLCLSVPLSTTGMHIPIYKMKSVTRKRCNLRYIYRRNCSSTIEIKLTPQNKTDVPR